jgi:hypothetical protein
VGHWRKAMQGDVSYSSFSSQVKEKGLANVLKDKVKDTRKLGIFSKSKCLNRPFSIAFAFSPNSPFDKIDPIDMEAKDLVAERLKSAEAEGDFIDRTMSKVWDKLSDMERSQLQQVHVLSASGAMPDASVSALRHREWGQQLQILDLAIPEQQRKAEVGAGIGACVVSVRGSSSLSPL